MHYCYVWCKKGIERTSKIFLPILIVLNIAIAIYVMTLPGALDGVLYYITPNFSKLSFGTIIAALGQLFLLHVIGYGYYVYVWIISK